jgi:membrane-associated phospholipid phosphatase
MRSDVAALSPPLAWVRPVGMTADEPRAEARRPYAGGPWARVLRSIPARTAIALALAVMLVVLFLEIADAVLDGEATRLDAAVAGWATGIDTPPLHAVMKIVTSLGSVVGIFVAATIVAAWTWVRRSRALGAVLVAVAIVAESLNQGLKFLFRRERPETFLDIVPLTTYAFPSGHAMASTAVYGMIAIVVARLRPGLTPLLWVATPVLVLAIGASRIVLGVHWATDVLAGFAAGGLVLVAGTLALYHVPARPASYPTQRSHEPSRSSGRSRRVVGGAG